MASAPSTKIAADGSDPVVFDSDGGGACDGGERFFGGDPSDAADDDVDPGLVVVTRSPLVDLLFGGPGGPGEGMEQPSGAFPSRVLCGNGRCVDADGAVVVDVRGRQALHTTAQIFATPDGDAVVFRDGASFVAHDLDSGAEVVVADEEDVREELGTDVRWWSPGAKDGGLHTLWFGSYRTTSEVTGESEGLPRIGYVDGDGPHIVLDDVIDCARTPGACADGAPTAYAAFDVNLMNVWPIGMDASGERALVFLSSQDPRAVAIDKDGAVTLIASRDEFIVRDGGLFAPHTLGWRADGSGFVGYDFVFRFRRGRRPAHRAPAPSPSPRAAARRRPASSRRS